MPKINKKNILITAAVVAVLAVVFIVYQSTRSKKPASLSEKFQQNLNIPNTFQAGGIKINNTIKSVSFDFPSSLPYLKVTKNAALNSTNINAMAVNLGFPEDPQTFTDIKNGSVSIWNNDKYSLVFTPKTGSILISSNQLTSVLIQNANNKNLSDKEFESLAQDLLINKLKINQNELKFLGFTYLKTQSGVENFSKTDKASAQIIQLNFSESTTEYPLITTNPDQAQISVQFLKDGSLLALIAKVGFSFQSSPNEYPLKNYEQFNNDIGKSVVVSLNDNNINLPDIKGADIQSIDIQTIDLAYLLDFSEQNVVQPVFLLTGTAVVSGYGKPVNASLYLPAFESFSQP